MKNSLIQPKDFTLPKIDHEVILFYQLDYFHQFRELTGVKKIKSFGPAKRFQIQAGKKRMCVLGGAIGAAMAAMTLENAIYTGGKSFTAFGSAGWIGAEKSEIGKLYSVNFGEDRTGISLDYGAESNSFQLETFNQIANLETQFENKKIVTTNSVYTLTPERLEEHRSKNISLIDMEAVPLSYVAKQAGAEFKSLFVISDLVDQNNQWQQGIGTDKLQKGIEEGFNLLLKMIDGLAR